MIQTDNSLRALRNDELDAVNGGTITFGGTMATSQFVNPGVIHGFDPQPDPPAIPVGIIPGPH